jgi:hypothetical protein
MNVHESVNRGEFLQRLHSSKAQHRALSSRERKVAILDLIVRVPPISRRPSLPSSRIAAGYCGSSAPVPLTRRIAQVR